MEICFEYVLKTKPIRLANAFQIHFEYENNAADLQINVNKGRGRVGECVRRQLMGAQKYMGPSKEFETCVGGVRRGDDNSVNMYE